MKFVVVMPFKPEFDPVFRLIKDAVRARTPESEAWECVRIDQDLTAGHITDKIEVHLRSADICIADLSGLNPNVMWEVGFIECQQKPLIALSQTTDSLPFNIKDVAVLRYELARVAETLGKPLMDAIVQTRAKLAKAIDTRKVAIVGSYTIGYQPALATLRRVATPYLSPTTTWYCGTQDPLEEAALKFLLDQRQRVVAVQWDNRQPSTAIAELLASNAAPLLDLDREPQGRYVNRAFNRKFTYFADHMDLIMLLWNGQSTRTKEFHEALTTMGRDHLLIRA